jgi:hypothetical protein
MTEDKQKIKEESKETSPTATQAFGATFITNTRHLWISLKLTFDTNLYNYILERRGREFRRSWVALPAVSSPAAMLLP